MIKFCKTCGLADLAASVCQLFRMTIDPEKDYCSKHKEHSEIKVCEACGRVIIEGATLVPEGENYHMLCQSCSDGLYSCGFCRNVNTCEFETNPSPLPKQVQQHIRQGNMVSIMTVKNPERIEITCKNGCSCYSEEFGCMRQNEYYCKGMDHIYGIKQED